MKIKAIVIEDEKKTRQALCNQIRKIEPEINIVDECDSVADAFEKINQHEPDVVFLDVQLLDGTGFDLLCKFSEINFHIIFTTAHDEHALKAFKFNALDYLLKPIHPGELSESIERLKESLDQTGESHEYYQEILNNLKSNNAQEQKIAISESKTIKFITLKEIVFLLAEGNYTSFKLLNGNTFLASKPLKHYLGLLSDKGFFRVHRSYALNLNLVKEFSTKEGYSAEMENGDIVTVAREQKKEFLDRLSLGFIS